MLKDMERTRSPSQASTRPPVSRATIWTVVKVSLVALSVIAPGIYVATKVWQRAKSA
jgi:hypothetical protein